MHTPIYLLVLFTGISALALLVMSIITSQRNSRHSEIDRHGELKKAA